MQDQGCAFDLDQSDGARVSADAARVRQLMAECRALGAIEVQCLRART